MLCIVQLGSSLYFLDPQSKEFDSLVTTFFQVFVNPLISPNNPAIKSPNDHVVNRCKITHSPNNSNPSNVPKRPSYSVMFVQVNLILV